MIQLLKPSSQQIEKLEIYLRMLMKRNHSINLTGFSDERLVRERLFADTFYLAPFLDGLLAHKSQPFIWDLGAGAGLPGIPLRTVWDKGVYIMVEARVKRALFMENALALLKLRQTKVFEGRAEKFFSVVDKKADCILSRAFRHPVNMSSESRTRCCSTLRSEKRDFRQSRSGTAVTV